jgi:capsular polysaccharide biosynthesis protein
MTTPQIADDEHWRHATAYPPPDGVLATEDYCRSGAPGLGRYQKLSDASSYNHSLPVTIDESVHWRFRHEAHRTAPERFLAEVHWGRVYGEGAVVTPTNRLLRDVSAMFDPPGGIPAAWEDHSLLRTSLPAPKFVDQRLAVISSIGAPNYYHWLLEILPRIGMVPRSQVDLFYVNADLDPSGFQRALLRLLGIADSKLLLAGPNTHIVARKLWVPSLPGALNWPSAYAYEFVRQLLFNLRPQAPGPERIYVSRSAGTRRHVLNEENEVWPWLKRRGFERVEPSTLPFEEQMRLFANAKIIVGPFGAGMTNMVFSPPGAQVIEFMPTHCVRLHYWALSNLCRHTYGYLFAEGARPPEYVHPDDGTQDLEVATSKLKTLFDRMGV